MSGRPFAKTAVHGILSAIALSMGDICVSIRPFLADCVLLPDTHRIIQYTSGRFEVVQQLPINDRAPEADVFG